MIYRSLFLKLILCLLSYMTWSQNDTALVFGELGKDINRPWKMIQLPGGNLLWAGEWNDDGIIMKLSPTGAEIKRLILSYTPGATLKIKDMVLDKDNTLIAAGECTKCVTTDSLARITLFRIDTGLGSVLQRSLLHGKTQSAPLIYNPTIARNDRALILQATQGAEGMDLEDIFLAAIDDQLDTLWTKSINSCEDCAFEYPYRLIATNNGFTSFAFHNFTDSATIFHFDDKGDIQWRQRAYTWNGVAGGSIAAANDKIFIGVGVRGLPQDPFFYVATILTYDEKNGTPLNATSLNDPFTDRAITSLEFAPNGNLIVGYRRLIGSFNGSLLTSQILRLDILSNDPKFIDSKTIPNPNDNISMGIIHAVALNEDGSRIAAIGLRGSNRTFFYTNPEVTVATRDISIPARFVITPNPVLEYHDFRINLSDDLSSIKNVHILIYNFNGQLIRRIHPPYGQTPLSVQGLPRGMYTIVVRSDHGSMANKLLVM